MTLITLIINKQKNATLNQFLIKRVVLKELRKVKPGYEEKTSLRAIVQRVLT